jgi:hypothetical protein
VHPQNQIAAPKHVAASMESGPNRSLSTAPNETSGTGWNLQDRADAASVPERSSFAERFAAVFEVMFFYRASLIRRMEDLIPNLR